ncbi:MAG TPA: HAMP domain-containing sensor histidine kinase, partial [Thermoanaerobaculia bacterium]|nr:HAMP domain-containing sensor histidine kinase [Thermoanaerobaculia bacterium]
VIEVLSSLEKAFTSREAETLVFLAEQAAIALRNARLIEELRRSNRLKDDFLANLSHEVRTPLTGIVGWAEVLLDSKGDDPETRKALRSILDQAETLSRMLGDLIDLSRIDNFGLEIRRTRLSLADVLAEAFDAVAPTAKKRGVTVVIDSPADLPKMEGDTARLKQVAWNLLTNAIKFSPQGETVSVAARRASKGGLELEVQDRGVGIDPAFLPFVFDRFRQEQSAPNRRFGGLGVGLTIARAIVEAHGGTIQATSEGHGRGSRFVVWFPPERFAKPSGAFMRAGPPPASFEGR